MNTDHFVFSLNLLKNKKVWKTTRFIPKQYAHY